MEIFTRIGRLIRVRNSQVKKYPYQNNSYLAVWIKDKDGNNPQCLLFTDMEISRAIRRAADHKEDLTERSWTSNLLD